MSPFIGYRCTLCGADYGPDEVAYICPKHGDSGNLDIVLDYAAIAATPAAEIVARPV